MANMNALQQMIFPDENAPIHRKNSSISEKHLKHDKEMMDAKNNLICKPEEIPSPKLTDWLKSSTTPWRSPLRHDSMPSTPLAWRFDSAEFTLKEDYEDLF